MRRGGPGTEEVRGGRGGRGRAARAGGTRLRSRAADGGRAGRRTASATGRECACAPLGGREGARPAGRGVPPVSACGAGSARARPWRSGARPGGARVRSAGGFAPGLGSGWGRREPRPAPPILPAGGGRKSWRLRREVEAPVGAGAARRSLLDRKPVPHSFPFSKHLGPLPPRAGRVRTSVRAVVTGVPAAEAHSFAGPGRGQKARAPRGGAAGPRSGPCGPRCRAKTVAGPAVSPLPATKGDTPVHGVECPWGPRDPARSGGKVTRRLERRQREWTQVLRCGHRGRGLGQRRRPGHSPPANRDPCAEVAGRGAQGGPQPSPAPGRPS